MKFIEIVADESKKAGIVECEKVILDAVKLIEKILVRASLESEESTIKSFAPVAGLVFQAIKPEIMKLADLNKSGVVGE